jgi:hypothetical protein
MKAEKIIDIIKRIKEDPELTRAALEELLADAEAELARECARAGGYTARLKAAQRIIKRCKKKFPAREAFHDAIMHEDKQIFTDFYSAAALFEPLPLKTSTAPENEINSIIRCIEGARGNEGAPLELPPLEELKAFIKIKKQESKGTKAAAGIMWDFGENRPAVNAEFLLDIMEVFPDVKSATPSERSPLTGAIYFYSQHGEGVLCPIRKAAKNENI